VFPLISVTVKSGAMEPEGSWACTLNEQIQAKINAASVLIFKERYRSKIQGYSRFLSDFCTSSEALLVRIGSLSVGE
jgi:hypothetical protein